VVVLVNHPEIVETLTRLHDDYERALEANDVAALMAFFWDSPRVVRYGVAEQLYGAQELRDYRQAQAPPITNRRLIRREISVFGDSCATVMCEISNVVAGVPRAVRQSQTWIRFPDAGWRVVAAHVSRPLTFAPWENYTDAMSRSLGLPLDGQTRAGAIANLERIAAVAAPLLAVPLGDDVETPAVFRA
jgi:hypothetical protein